jgi:hypothetical protein
VHATVVRGDQLLYKLRPTVERGITVYRVAGVWHTGSDLTPEIQATADRWYQGGYVYSVPDSELEEMELQGIHASVTFDAFIDEFTETF